MCDAKHTPGPWEWVGRDLESNSPGHYKAVIETSVSCGQFCYGGSVDLKISDADKRLIAAAPDLLEALSKRVKDAEQRVFEDWLARTAPSGDAESVQNQWEDSYDFSDFCEEWEAERAALAKTTGASHV